MRAAEFERILARGPRAFLDEALHVDGVLVGVHAAPRADRNMRVAHDVFDQQVRHRVAELRVARFGPPALHLAAILAVDDARRVEPGIDRLAGRLHVQADQLALLVEARRHLAHRDRAIEIVRLILLAAPDQLDRRAGKFLRDGDRLMHVILRAAAPAEAAAEIVAVHFAFRERDAGRFRQRRERGFEILRRHPDLGLVGRELHGRVHHLHAGMREERRRIGRLDLLRRARDRRERVALLALAVVLGRRQGRP